MAKTAAQRQKEYRDKKRNAPVTENVTVDGQNVTRVTASVTHEQEGALRMKYASDTGLHYACRLDYYLGMSDYIPRREPDRLNWGPWMDSTQLEQAGLKANRVPIPGDWDYKGVA